MGRDNDRAENEDVMRFARHGVAGRETPIVDLRSGDMVELAIDGLGQQCQILETAP
jgi:hypothetical protein